MKIPEGIRCYGDMSKRGSCPSEASEQVSFVKYVRLHGNEHSLTIIHNRNEGKRSFYQAAKHKAEGMTRGASDIIIPGSPTFVCEMKRANHTLSKWQDGQIEYLEACHKLGSFACVALGFDGAIEAYKEWARLCK